jgi:uncharacterized protein involved in high-affinity Fe2+ transport
MSSRWIGPLITLMILSAVAGVLFWNLESAKPPAPSAPQLPPTNPAQQTPVRITPAGFREYPIGDTEQNHLQIAAVWLPSVHMAGMAAAVDPDVIHLEADIKSTEKNPNGFAEGEFVPYLTVRYTIEPESGGTKLEGTMLPMIASDGLHYGASISMPKAGRYRLTYAIEPPSSGGLGRHDDPQTGVAQWWEPFRVAFDWNFPGVPGSTAAKK